MELTLEQALQKGVEAHKAGKALEKFYENNDYSYEVIAISFFTKQVAVRLLNIWN